MNSCPTALNPLRHGAPWGTFARCALSTPKCKHDAQFHSRFYPSSSPLERCWTSGIKCGSRVSLRTGTSCVRELPQVRGPTYEEIKNRLSIMHTGTTKVHEEKKENAHTPL